MHKRKFKKKIVDVSLNLVNKKSLIKYKVIEKIIIFAEQKRQMSDSTSRSGNDTLTVETGVRIPYPIQKIYMKR